MSRYSQKIVDGIKFELRHFNQLNDQLAYNACLFINDEFIATIVNDHNGLTYTSGITNYLKVIAEYDRQFEENKKRWSYKGESHQYSVTFIVSLIAQRIMSHCHYSTHKTLADSMMQLELERARLKESEHERKMLEGHLVSLQSTIRSQQVYNHIKPKYNL